MARDSAPTDHRSAIPLDVDAVICAKPAAVRRRDMQHPEVLWAVVAAADLGA